MSSFFDANGTEQFKGLLRRGNYYVGLVWQRLLDADIPAIKTEMRFRETLADRAQFENDQDLYVPIGTERFVIEVKSRAERFLENPGDFGRFPYQTAYVDTVAGWDKKVPEPRAVVQVSQVTKEMLVVPVQLTKPSWIKVVGPDHTRGFEAELFYACPRDLLFPFDALVKALHRRLRTAA